MKQTKKYALPIVVVMAVLLAFSSPAAADYTGDHPLTIYDHDTINGGLVYETITDGSGYTQLWAIPMEGTDTYSQDITISIPAGATVKMARLYNTYCWSKPDFGHNEMPGYPAEAELTFNGVTVTCKNPCDIGCFSLECRDALPNPIVYDNDVIHYWDTKGVGYGTPTWWDFPSGEFAWDVTDIVREVMVDSSGTFTATITNVDRTPTPFERFVTFGFGLLIVYEKPSSPLIDYWVAEGCDALLARTFETPENATTSATFGGVSNPIKADLTTVLTCSQGGNPTDWAASLNMIYFNGVEIGPSTAEGDMHYGVNLFDVTSLLSSGENVVEFQDRNDCEYVHNAFLVVEKPVISVIPASVDITPETVNLKSNGQLVTAYIELPEGYDVANIDATTVCLGTVQAVTDPQYGFVTDPESYLMDNDGDGIMERMVKFDRAAVVAYLKTVDYGYENGNSKIAELTVTGNLVDGTAFEGSDTVRVIG